MTALPLTTYITQTAQKTVKYTTITSQFGDGYMQRAGDGINKKGENWLITYDNLDQTQRDLLWVFIEIVQQSDVIEWTAPGDLVEKKWIIDPASDIAEQAKAGAIYTVRFTLKRVFDL
jgi:phage-related protein